MRRIWIYGRNDEKVGQITTGILCFAFFCDCATRSQLSFLRRLRSIAALAAHRDHFVWCLSVRLSVR